MSGGWRITAPLLTDEQRAQAVTPGGLAGAADPGDTARALLLGLQRLAHLYEGTAKRADVQARRERNKKARKARRITRRSA